jgi:tRNA1(Val) A37 N6-methylase TrmN6
MEITSGHLLDGQLVYAQPANGYRTGIEPVLLAASVPARAGQTVLELGTGAGAGLLCLARRLPQIAGVGVERDPEMAELARRNVASNGLQDRLSILTGDILTALPAAGRFDHAFANPPWHATPGTESPNPAKEAAKRAAPGDLSAWAGVMAAHLAQRGTATVILPAASMADGVRALSDRGCGAISLLPLWPMAGRDARLILLQGTRGAAGPCRVLSGLVLHPPDGGYTEAADSILRQGLGTPLAT